MDSIPSPRRRHILISTFLLSLFTTPIFASPQVLISNAPNTPVQSIITAAPETNIIESVVTVPGAQPSAIRITSIQTATPVTITSTPASSATDPPSFSSPSSTPPPTPAKKGPNKVILIAASLGGSLVLIALFMGLYFHCTKRRRRQRKSLPPMSDNFFEPPVTRLEPTIPILAHDPPPKSPAAAYSTVTQYPTHAPFLQSGISPERMAGVSGGMGVGFGPMTTGGWVQDVKSFDGSMESSQTRPGSLMSNPSSVGTPGVGGQVRDSMGRPIGHRSHELHLWAPSQQSGVGGGGGGEGEGGGRGGNGGTPGADLAGNGVFPFRVGHQPTRPQGSAVEIDGVSAPPPELHGGEAQYPTVQDEIRYQPPKPPQEMP